MKDLLDKFAEIDSNRDGLVDLEEFAEYLNLPVTRQVKHLFSLYDRVSVTFKVYIVNHKSSFNSEASQEMPFLRVQSYKDGRCIACYSVNHGSAHTSSL